MSLGCRHSARNRGGDPAGQGNFKRRFKLQLIRTAASKSALVLLASEPARQTNTCRPPLPLPSECYMTTQISQQLFFWTNSRYLTMALQNRSRWSGSHEPARTGSESYRTGRWESDRHALACTYHGVIPIPFGLQSCMLTSMSLLLLHFSALHPESLCVLQQCLHLIHMILRCGIIFRAQQPRSGSSS